MFKMLTLFFLLGILYGISAQELSKQKGTEVQQFGIYDNDLLPADFHKKNRENLRRLMPENSVAVFFANSVKTRSNDVTYEYHQDPNFYYLTGLNEPHAVLVIYKNPTKINGEKTSEILFVRSKDKDEEVWTGKRLGEMGAELFLEIEMAESTKNFNATDLQLKNKDKVFFFPLLTDAKDDPFDRIDLYNLIRQFDAKSGVLDEEKIDNRSLLQWMAQLREIKSEEELYLMKKAINITCKAQKELMKSITPEMKEYEAEAIVEYIFKMNGAEYPGFPSILGSGENSCVLHYNTNRKTITENSLIVCDIGAEYHGYTADVTRTIPANGKYSKEQKIIYDIVLKAQKAGIAKCKKGKSFWDPNIAATSVVSQELQKLGIIKSPLEIRRYFMHGTSHYLGLDVHDVGTYLPLKPNTVITVEPGIYIPENSPCDPKWWNIGVRIEDDVLITDDKPVVLSDCVPKTTEEIEELMQQEGTINR